MFDLDDFGLEILKRQLGLNLTITNDYIIIPDIQNKQIIEFAEKHKPNEEIYSLILNYK